MSEIERLLEKSVSEKSVRNDPNNSFYTIPRTFGVYEITIPDKSKTFRFGNHPVRENELLREFNDNIKRIGLFLERNDAKNLAKHLNS